MYTIGVISDTHRSLPDKAVGILCGDYSRSQVLSSLSFDDAATRTIEPSKVDLIIHAGDIGELTPISQDVIDGLERIAPVKAVLGNRDLEGYTTSEGLLSEQLLAFAYKGMTFAVMHKPEDLNAAIKQLGETPQILVHGHTHQPTLQRRGKGLLMNPGAIHNPKGEWSRRTVGLIHCDESALIAAEIIKL